MDYTGDASLPLAGKAGNYISIVGIIRRRVEASGHREGLTVVDANGLYAFRLKAVAPVSLDESDR
jgi:hypothetical protein